MINVVVFGGGNGCATTLCALKPYIEDLRLSAVVTMSDSGGSSGRLRDEYNCLPSGDILRAILALSPINYRKILRPLFNKKRFSGVGALDGHSLGNIFLTFAAKHSGNYIEAVRALEQAVSAQGVVYPATITPHHLAVRLVNDEVIIGEANIDKPSYFPLSRIASAYLEPSVEAVPEAIKAINKADIIILGPGSLYTSIISSLLPKGIKKAISESTAKIIFIAGNAVEDKGETGPIKLTEMVEELSLYLPRAIDGVVYNNAKLNSTTLEAYQRRSWRLINDDFKNASSLIIRGDFERKYGGLDEHKLGKILYNYIENLCMLEEKKEQVKQSV